MHRHKEDGNTKAPCLCVSLPFRMRANNRNAEAKRWRRENCFLESLSKMKVFHLARFSVNAKIINILVLNLFDNSEKETYIRKNT